MVEGKNDLCLDGPFCLDYEKSDFRDLQTSLSLDPDFNQPLDTYHSLASVHEGPSRLLLTIRQPRSYSYLDHFTEEKIPLAERIGAGASLPVALVLGVFGCESENKIDDYRPFWFHDLRYKSVTAGDKLSFEMSVTQYVNPKRDLVWEVTRTKSNREQSGAALPQGIRLEKLRRSGDEDRVLFVWETEDDIEPDSYYFRVSVTDGRETTYKFFEIFVRRKSKPAQPSHNNGSSSQPPREPKPADICPHIAINNQGDIAASWMRKNDGLVFSNGHPAANDVPQDTKKVPNVIGDVSLCSSKKAIDNNEEGLAVLCWKNSAQVFCQQLDSEGENVVAPTSVAQGVTGQYSVSQFEDGTYAVVWESEGQIKLQVFAKSGHPNSLEIEVGEGQTPDVAVIDDEVYVVYLARRNNADPPVYDSAKWQRFSNTGEKIGAMHTVNESGVLSPSIAVNEEGFVALSFFVNGFGYRVPKINVYKPNGEYLFSPSTSLIFSSNPPISGNPAIEDINHTRENSRIFLNNAGRGVFAFSTAESIDSNVILSSQFDYWAPLTPAEVQRRSSFGGDHANRTFYSLAANQTQAWIIYGGKEFTGARELPVKLVQLEDLSEEPAIVDEPKIAMFTPEVDFGSIALDTETTREFEIQNRGREVLEISPQIEMITALEDQPFSVSPDYVTIQISSLETLTLRLAFSPSVIGDQEARLVLTTNDPDRPEIEVRLMGHGHPAQHP